MSKEKTKTDPLLGNDESQNEAPEQTAKPKVAKVEAPAEKPVAPAAATAKPNAGKDIVAETKNILKNSPHTNFIIPLGEGEKDGAYDTVQINGYRLVIKKGVMVNIPLPVANLLAEKYKIAMTAGQEKRIDRTSDVSEALG